MPNLGNVRCWECGRYFPLIFQMRPADACPRCIYDRRQFDREEAARIRVRQQEWERCQELRYKEASTRFPVYEYDF
jgi:hypothetical protein